jgi:hypothetical protein
MSDLPTCPDCKDCPDPEPCQLAAAWMEPPEGYDPPRDASSTIRAT